MSRKFFLILALLALAPSFAHTFTEISGYLDMFDYSSLSEMTYANFYWPLNSAVANGSLEICSGCTSREDMSYFSIMNRFDSCGSWSDYAYSLEFYVEESDVLMNNFACMFAVGNSSCLGIDSDRNVYMVDFYDRNVFWDNSKWTILPESCGRLNDSWYSLDVALLQGKMFFELKEGDEVICSASTPTRYLPSFEYSVPYVGDMWSRAFLRFDVKNFYFSEISKNLEVVSDKIAVPSYSSLAFEPNFSSTADYCTNTYSLDAPTFFVGNGFEWQEFSENPVTFGRVSSEFQWKAVVNKSYPDTVKSGIISAIVRIGAQEFSFFPEQVSPDSSCPQGYSFIEGGCKITTYCGDDICDYLNENCRTCEDCYCPEGEFCRFSDMSYSCVPYSDDEYYLQGQYLYDGQRFEMAILEWRNSFISSVYFYPEEDSVSDMSLSVLNGTEIAPPGDAFSVFRFQVSNNTFSEFIFDLKIPNNWFVDSRVNPEHLNFYFLSNGSWERAEMNRTYSDMEFNYYSASSQPAEFFLISTEREFIEKRANFFAIILICIAAVTAVAFVVYLGFFRW